MECPKCHFENPDDSRFCGKCAAPLPSKEDVFDVVGCVMEVLNELGHGLLERPYENALVVEPGLKNILVQHTQ